MYINQKLNLNPARNDFIVDFSVLKVSIVPLLRIVEISGSKKMPEPGVMFN